LKGLNAPTIVWPFSCDEVGDEEEDEDEIEEDLLCSSLSIND